MDEQFVLSKKRKSDDENFEDNFNNHKRGIALIFSHTKFLKKSPLIVAKFDRECLMKMLESYGFEVRIYDDLNYREIKDTLESVSNEDHSNNDCLFVSVTSHGILGKIFAQDRTYPVEELWKPFFGNKCPSLINKPKLFFIDACRGTKLGESVQLKRNKRMAAKDINSIEINYSLPITANLLVMFSTFEGYLSAGYANYGSLLIQCLCEELSEVNEKIEIYSLLTSVARKVVYEFGTSDKQMPTILSTLINTFYLVRNNQ